MNKRFQKVTYYKLYGLLKSYVEFEALVLDYAVQVALVIY